MIKYIEIASRVSFDDLLWAYYVQSTLLGTALDTYKYPLFMPSRQTERSSVHIRMSVKEQRKEREAFNKQTHHINENLLHWKLGYLPVGIYSFFFFFLFFLCGIYRQKMSSQIADKQMIYFSIYKLFEGRNRDFLYVQPCTNLLGMLWELWLCQLFQGFCLYCRDLADTSDKFYVS